MNYKNDYKRIIMLILIGVLAYLMLSNFEFVIAILVKIKDAIFPFVLGIVLAFVLNIFMTKIENLLNKAQEKRKKKIPTRGISIAISLIIFVLGLTFIALELVPELVNNINSLIKNIPTIFQNIENYIMKMLEDFPQVQDKIKDIFSDTANINNLLVNILNYIANGFVGFVTNFVTSIITIFTSLIFAIYMLSQKEELIGGCKKFIYAYLPKKKADKLMEIGKLSNYTFTKFVSGQCLEALILGCIFFVILTLFRFPYALLISVLTTITALIPIFGALIAMVIGAVLIATVNPLQALLFVGLYLIIQQIEGNVIYPKVVGKSVGLSPIWTLLAVTVGGNLFGIPGMLIGLPLASIVYALIKKDVNSKVKDKNNKIDK